ncbi:hypothetical protein COCC4DRAFT_64398 [Bipolaris maydis ATCC 48331]|uniref:Uncharacterized protein n=2 Tax=Cochliobolus heterostrophus TaxID=5016 RepID=M2TAT4_COCH5|nr:uncharacterized protein COCC4DRAFT_64398 [Bipolaris maydis ATCC 48331]EMD94680.1 hypothetical protein COCHEDRAFT_1152550 [Bipolaris maydis C5]ENI01608.1 hypothetical protein COCC4DRAFT_64398 [Bipolaris maydis ATCC 48331]KAJ6287419.1 hypothetical protein J3E71DRAFT_165222 [Bipolaris maydis]
MAPAKRGRTAKTDDHHSKSPGSRHVRQGFIISYPPRKYRSITHRAMTSAQKYAKQQHLEEQVHFIIITRDNNKPNAYGTASTAHGPLTWAAVAKAYNEKYNVSVTAAAMEKRVRQHRALWLSNHPNYPTTIVYAKKDKCLQTPCPDTSARERRDRSTHDLLDKRDANEHVAGWLPPDDIRNQSDMRSYIERGTAINTGVVTIQILNGHGEPVDAISIDCHIFQKSACLLGRLRSSELTLEVQLNGSAVAAIQCYVLEDDHVKGLVLDRWRMLADQAEEVELELDELDLLFDCTEDGDAARTFWVEAVCAAGLSEGLLTRKKCGIALAEHVRDLMLSYA